MEHYQLPPGAEEYWITAVKRGVGYKMLIGSRFAGSTQKLIKEKCMTEDTFRNMYCIDCSKYESAYTDEEVVEKVLECLSETGRRLIFGRPLITTLLETTLEVIEDKDPLVTELCRSLLDEIDNMYVNWINPINYMKVEIQFDDYEHSNLVSLDCARFVERVFDRHDIKIDADVVKEITAVINSELNDPLNSEEVNYTPYYRLSDVNIWLQNNYENYNDQKECNGCTDIAKEGNCIKATKTDLYTSKFVTSVIPPHTFVYYEPDMFYMYGHKQVMSDFHALLCGNVYCDGQVCWGVLESQYKKLEHLPFLYEFFWKSRFNSDLEGNVDEIKIGTYPLESTKEYFTAKSNVLKESINTTNVVGILALTLTEYEEINPEVKGKINPVSGKNFFLFLYKNEVKKKLYVNSLMVSTICDITGQTKKILYLDIDGDGNIKLAAEEQQDENLPVT